MYPFQTIDHEYFRQIYNFLPSVAGYLVSRRGTRLLTYQGFRFCFVRYQTNGRCRWVCSQKSSSNGCKATALTEADRIVCINNTHSHPRKVERKKPTVNIPIIDFESTSFPIPDFLGFSSK